MKKYLFLGGEIYNLRVLRYTKPATHTKFRIRATTLSPNTLNIIKLQTTIKNSKTQLTIFPKSFVSDFWGVKTGWSLQKITPTVATLHVTTYTVTWLRWWPLIPGDTTATAIDQRTDGGRIHGHPVHGTEPRTCHRLQKNTINDWQFSPKWLFQSFW